jgi:hypothetical protein
MSSTGNRFLVMMGVDAESKAHAARFNASDETAVRKAAGLMGWRIGVATSAKALELARKLPEGKLFESGKGMVPLAREELFYELAKVLSFNSAWISAGVISGTGTGTIPNSSVVKAADVVWSAIQVGSTVLAFDFGEPEIPLWNAAIVTAISKDGETLTARWRDFPQMKSFVLKAKLVGLLRPDIAS